MAQRMFISARVSFLHVIRRCIKEEIVVLFFKFIFINLFLAVFGLCCCTGAFSSCGEWGLLFVAECGLLMVVASHCGAQALGMWASVVVACRLSSCGSQALEHRLSSCGTRA